MSRTIQFWQIVNLDLTPLTTAFPKQYLFTEMLKAKAAQRNVEALAADGTALHLEVYDYNPASPFTILYRPRRQNQGHMNDHGVIRPMPFTEGQHVTEPTYLAFFARNVVGFLFHNEGPRPRRLTEYLNKKFGASLALVPIYRKDLDATLREISLQYLEITIPASQAANLTPERDGAFATALAAAGQLLLDGSVVLRIAVGRGGKAARRQERKRNLLQQALDFVGLGDHAAYTKAKAVGTKPNKRSLSVDLLEERFVHKVVVDAADFVPGEKNIRDDTPYISRQWEADRLLLEGATPDLESNDEDPGLLAAFRENPAEDGGNAGHDETRT